jgi:hypothetical protein
VAVKTLRPRAPNSLKVVYVYTTFVRKQHQ